MYKVKWDAQNNGIILSDNISEEESIPAPRPVFLQELQILEIDKKYRLPKTDKPICWNIESRYYYKGQPFFERRGAAIYSKPTIVFNDGFAFDTLEAIDIDKIVRINSEAIETIENEAMDFILGCYEAYKDKVDDYVVAFSGGKDSQVILDLVTRVLPVESFKAVFQDTDMELPCTYDIVKYTEEDYKYRFPNFRLYHAKNDRSALDLWKQYGPPSRVNRWCCSVMKTAVFRRTMKELHNTSNQPKVVVYEGVRADESTRREAYDRIGVNVKHHNIINCRAIFRWNNSEIFLYLFSRGIELNPAYRMGLTRVGCGVCPFASDWSEYLIRRIYPDISKKYVSVIEQMAKNLGLNSRDKINEYISSGNWQKNAGGRGLIPDGSRVDLISKEPVFECVVTQPKSDWRIWLFAMCQFVSREEDGITKGELNFNGELYRFNVTETNSTIRFVVEGTVNKPALHGLLSRVLTKTAGCELCGVCEAECPTGALTVRGKVVMNKDMCIHCHKCLEVSSRGCIIAHRKQINEGGMLVKSANMRTSGIDRYSTFGLRDEWVDVFFDKGDAWFGSYPNLGTKMIPAAINWLREAELIDAKEKKTSDRFELIKDLYDRNKLAAWQVIWVSLAYNSAIVNSFVKSIKQDVSYSRDDVVAIIREDFPSLNDNTIKNPTNALITMLRYSPLGCLTNERSNAQNIYVAELHMSGNSTRGIRRVSPGYVSMAALVYLLYKEAESTDSYDLTVSDLLTPEGLNPYSVLGMTADSLIPALKALAQMGVLTADLTGGLENVHLIKDMTPDDALSEVIRRV
jgi:phosphoadenosine phosphosulfate reductase